MHLEFSAAMLPIECRETTDDPGIRPKGRQMTDALQLLQTTVRFNIREKFWFLTLEGGEALFRTATSYSLPIDLVIKNFLDLRRTQRAKLCSVTPGENTLLWQLYIATYFLSSFRRTWLLFVSAAMALDTDVSPDLSPLSLIFSRDFAPGPARLLAG